MGSGAGTRPALSCPARAPCCLCCRCVCAFVLLALATTMPMRCGGQIAFICGGGGQRRAGGCGRGWGSPGPAGLRGGSACPPCLFLRSYTSRRRVVGTKGMGASCRWVRFYGTTGANVIRARRGSLHAARRKNEMTAEAGWRVGQFLQPILLFSDGSHLL